MTSDASDAGPATRWPGASRAIARISRTLGILGVVAMVASINIEVLGRNLFSAPTTWVTEVATYLVVAITFFTAAAVAVKGTNIRTDFVVQFLPEHARRLIERAGQWVLLLAALVLGWAATGYMLENFHSGTRSWSMIATPMWIPQTAMVVGAALLIAVLALQAMATGTDRKLANLFSWLCIAAAIGIAFVEPFFTAFARKPQLVVAAMAGAVALAMLASERRTAIVATLLAVGAAVALFYFTKSAPLGMRGIVLVGALLVLLFSGIPVAFGLLSLGLLAMLFWLPPVTLNSVGERAWGAVATFELTAIPMFVLMGVLLVKSEVSSDLFRAASAWLGRLKAGLAYASVVASGLFAAVSGSSLATAATMGKVAGSEMLAAGYRPTLAYGVLAAGGTLGIMIPPSIAMIVYGPMAGVPVIQLFMAGLLPGLLIMVGFAVVIAVWNLVSPSVAPAGTRLPLAEKLRSLTGILPFLVLILLVLGSLYRGIVTPTEAGGFGALGAAAISLAKRRLTLAGLVEALEEAAAVTSFLLIIAIASAVMTFGADYLSMPQHLVSFIGGLQLSDIGLFLTIVIFYLILGMFIEPISMILITLPIVLPIIATAGWDPLWFGIVLVMLVEIGLITPPVGMILFVLTGMSQGRASFAQVSAGSFPFVVAILVMAGVFYAFPGLVTVLPEYLAK